MKKETGRKWWRRLMEKQYERITTVRKRIQNMRKISLSVELDGERL